MRLSFLRECCKPLGCTDAWIVEVSSVDDETVFAAALCYVQGFVGEADEVFGGRDGGAERRATDAHGDLAIRPGVVAYGFEQGVGELGGFGLADTGQENEELFSAVPDGHAAGTGEIAEQRCEDLEGAVACIMAQAVIELLEVVDVDQKDGERKAGGVGAGELGGVAFVERAAVEEAGKGIGGGQVLKLQVNCAGRVKCLFEQEPLGTEVNTSVHLLAE